MSSTALQVFQFEAEEVRTLIGEDGEPRWVAVDIGRVLNLRNVRMSLRSLDEDDVSSTEVIDGMGRIQETAVVNESGLYALIMKSRRPEARAFKRWITHEVLPSIRRTGAYSALPVESEVDKLASLLSRTLPPVTAQVQQMDVRLLAVETRQRETTDGQAINERMTELHRIKTALVRRTAGTAQPVTHAEFWRKLHDAAGIASFAHRAALTVAAMDVAVAFAREWWADRNGGVATLEVAA